MAARLQVKQGQIVPGFVAAQTNRDAREMVLFLSGDQLLQTLFRAAQVAFFLKQHAFDEQQLRVVGIKRPPSEAAGQRLVA